MAAAFTAVVISIITLLINVRQINQLLYYASKLEALNDELIELNRECVDICKKCLAVYEMSEKSNEG